MKGRFPERRTSGVDPQRYFTTVRYRLSQRKEQRTSKLICGTTRGLPGFERAARGDHPWALVLRENVPGPAAESSRWQIAVSTLSRPSTWSLSRVSSVISSSRVGSERAGATRRDETAIATVATSEPAPRWPHRAAIVYRRNHLASPAGRCPSEQAHRRSPLHSGRRSDLSRFRPLRDR